MTGRPVGATCTLCRDRTGGGGPAAVRRPHCGAQRPVPDWGPVRGAGGPGTGRPAPAGRPGRCRGGPGTGPPSPGLSAPAQPDLGAGASSRRPGRPNPRKWYPVPALTGVNITCVIGHSPFSLCLRAFRFRSCYAFARKSGSYSTSASADSGDLSPRRSTGGPIIPRIRGPYSTGGTRKWAPSVRILTKTAHVRVSRAERGPPWGLSTVARRRARGQGVPDRDRPCPDFIPRKPVWDLPTLSVRLRSLGGGL